MNYLYETHLHTVQGSACGRSEGREYPQIYKRLGYAGIFVTDHFFQGNCAVPKELPWRQRVDAYMAGYRDAKAEGDRIGFDVFFGIEQNFEGDEYLVYGIDAEFLYANPEIETWTRPELIRHVHEYGGAVVQAHPFRERGYLKEIHLMPCGVDAVEGINTANHMPEQDELAVRYAQNLGLRMTCGNDIHRAEAILPEIIGATVTQRKIESSRDFADLIRSSEPMTAWAPDRRGEWTGSAQTHLPVIVHGADGSVIGHDAQPYLAENGKTE